MGSLSIGVYFESVVDPSAVTVLDSVVFPSDVTDHWVGRLIFVEARRLATIFCVIFSAGACKPSAFA